MKRNIIVIAGALALVICLAAQTFAQGLYWESITAGKGDKESASQFYYMPRMYKAVMDNGENAIIIRLDKEKMLMVDNKKKAYWEMTFAEMEAMMKGANSQLQEAMKQMEKELANMPPEQRKMVEEMMGKNPMMKSEAKVEVKKTGEKQTISKYACTKYVLKEGGNDVATVWATKDISDFKVMQKDMQEFGKRMAAMMPGNLAGQVDRSINDIDGFPVRTEMKDGTTMTVTSVEKRSTPVSEFEAPPGYKKEEPPMRGTGE